MRDPDVMLLAKTVMATDGNVVEDRWPPMDIPG